MKEIPELLRRCSPLASPASFAAQVAAQGGMPLHTPPRPPTASSAPSAVLTLCAATAAVLLLGFSCLSCIIFPLAGAAGARAQWQQRPGLDVAPLRFLAVGDWGRNGTFNQTLVANQVLTSGSLRF